MHGPFPAFRPPSSPLNKLCHRCGAKDGCAADRMSLGDPSWTHGGGN